MKINNILSFGIIHKVEWFERKIDENKFIKYVKQDGQSKCGNS